MADRCYLYATDHLPGSREWEQQRQLQGIGEWSLDIPLTFQLLMSGDPIPVRSSIWNSEENIALAGEARAGLKSLNAYLALLPRTAAPLVSQTTEFFLRPENCRRYFVLECGEIFDLRGKNLAAQNNELLKAIRKLSLDIASIPVPDPDAARELLITPFSRRSTDPLDDFCPLGLGNWSSILYYQFGENEA
ncbi:hypothetical protein [Nevskia ramosa]|uniref:DUF7822 domain-containing protein n=1 Tax=Nevskia ramosa TaxID=64002 RepID=UPI003D148D5B